MIHRIDAKDRVERIIIKGQPGIRVCHGKGYSICLIGVGCPLSSRSDSGFICVDARNSATQAIDEITCRSAGAASHFKSVMLRSQIKPRKEAIVFVDRIPTVLTNVLTKCFLADRLQDLFREMAVRAIEEINALCHCEGTFQSI